MSGLGITSGMVGLVGAILGLLPFILLFVDYRKRGQIHKPLIYLAVFCICIGVLLPLLIRIFGIWLALITPFAVLGYAIFARSARR